MPQHYSPPVLDKRVRLRNPIERPIVSTDDFGRETQEPDDLPVGLAFDPTNGDLVLAGLSPRRVYRRDATTGLWDTGVAPPTQDNDLRALAVDPRNGEILGAGNATNTVYRLSGGSWSVEVANPAGATSPRGLAFDPVTYELLLVDNATERIYRRDAGTGDWDDGIDHPPADSNIQGVAVLYIEPTDIEVQFTSGVPAFDVLSLASISVEFESGVPEFNILPLAPIGPIQYESGTPTFEALLEAAARVTYESGTSAFEPRVALPLASPLPLLVIGLDTMEVYRGTYLDTGGVHWDPGVELPPAATGMQAFAIDTLTGDWWIADNQTDLLYRRDATTGLWDAGIPGPSGQAWGVVVWANRADRAPREQIQDGVLVNIGSTIWTIRYRENVAPDVEVVYQGQTFDSVGPPVIRGGAGHGRAVKYLEIHSRRRV